MSGWKDFGKDLLVCFDASRAKATDGLNGREVEICGDEGRHAHEGGEEKDSAHSEGQVRQEFRLRGALLV